MTDKINTLFVPFTPEEIVKLRRYIALKDIRNSNGKLIAASGFVSILVRNYIEDEIDPILNNLEKNDE